MRRLWATVVGWDDAPPPDILRIWEQYKKELPLLSQISIPRRLTDDNVSFYDLIGFCDASCKGYAAFVYLYLVYKDQ